MDDADRERSPPRVVVRERADETHGGIRRTSGDDREIGMLRFAGLSQPIEAARELDNPAAITQCVEGVRMHTLRDQIARAQRAAAVAESADGSVKVSALHGRYESHQLFTMGFAFTQPPLAAIRRRGCA